jgi:hypothetical protein
MSGAPVPDGISRKYRNLSVHQTEVLAQIATGVGLPRARPSTLSSLELKGLIERRGDEVLGSDRFGVIAVPQYEMPTHEHIPFIEWLAALDQVERSGARRVCPDATPSVSVDGLSDEPMSDDELSDWRDIAYRGSASGECAGSDLRSLIARLDAAESAVAALQDRAERAEGTLRDVEAAVPDTYYAHLPLWMRVEKMASAWDRAVRLTDDLAGERDDLATVLDRWPDEDAEPDESGEASINAVPASVDARAAIAVQSILAALTRRSG